VIQGALEVLGLPYTGSGVLGSALGMDKLRCKQVWTATGIPTPEFELLASADAIEGVSERLGLPLAVKPNREGSSLGISKVESADTLAQAWQEAVRYDEEVIAERWIEGAELTATILGDRDLPLIRLQTPRGFYDFAAKYESDSTQYLCPCGLTKVREQELRDLARRAFRTLGCTGWGRIDLILDASDRPYFLEANTVPGMTDHSLVPMAARHAGIDFDDLVLRILETSAEHG